MIDRPANNVLNHIARIQASRMDFVPIVTLQAHLTADDRVTHERLESLLRALQKRGYIELDSDSVHCSLTFEGWLESEFSACASTVIETTLRLLQQKAKGGAGAPTVTWEELQKHASLPTDSMNVAAWVLQVARLCGRSSRSDTRFEFTAPSDATLWGRVHDIGEFRAIHKAQTLEFAVVGRVLPKHTRVAAQLAYDHLKSTGSWPLTKKLNITLNEQGIDLSTAVRSSTALRGDDVYTDGAQTYVTLHGLVLLEAARADVELLIVLLRAAAERYASDPMADSHPVLELLGPQERAATTVSRLVAILAIQGHPFRIENAPNLEKARLGVSADLLNCRRIETVTEFVSWLQEVWMLGPPERDHKLFLPTTQQDSAETGSKDQQAEAKDQQATRPAARDAKQHPWLANPAIPLCMAIVCVILYFALRPGFTNEQSFWIVRTIVSVVCAALAVAALNGFINITARGTKRGVGTWTLRATGGLAVMLLFYLYTPDVLRAKTAQNQANEHGTGSAHVEDSGSANLHTEDPKNGSSDTTHVEPTPVTTPPERETTRPPNSDAAKAERPRRSEKSGPPPGSVAITSYNQSGGITAQNVTVNGPRAPTYAVLGRSGPTKNGDGYEWSWRFKLNADVAVPSVQVTAHAPKANAITVTSSSGMMAAMNTLQGPLASGDGVFYRWQQVPPGSYVVVVTTTDPSPAPIFDLTFPPVE